MLGRGADASPLPRRQWRGLSPEQIRGVWEEGGALPGYYLDDLSIPIDRFRIPPRELAELLPQQLLMLDVAKSALEDAGSPALDPGRSGVFIGLGLDLRTTDFHFRWAVKAHAAEWARTAEDVGIGTVWAGAGNNTPSNSQLDLMLELKPTIWAGMGSYGLHLANLAEARGIDLSKATVRKIIVAAEPLSPAKRQKLERAWNAEVFDLFGMTEAAFVAGEGPRREGLYNWDDIFFCEVVDEKTGAPLPHGETGSLVLTPLRMNDITPFLRWSSGDIVSMSPPTNDGAQFGMFPILRHARRTVGFFKVRGVNINHNELEDLMFFEPEVSDFRAEAQATEGGLDVLHLFVEPRRGVDGAALSRKLIEKVSRVFESTPKITLLEIGTIGREFEATLKAARFVDKRG